MVTLKKIFALIVAVVLLASCEKTGEVYVIKQAASVDGLAASSANLVLTEEHEADSALTISWDPAEFGEKAAVTYTLQVTVPADTTGENAWSKAKPFVAGNNVFKYTFLAGDFNNLITSLGLAAGTAQDVVFRVKADLNRTNNTTASPIESAYSNSLTIQATPYTGEANYPSLWVPGAFQGWDPSKAPKIYSVKSDNVYEGYINISTAGEFKLTAQPDWTPMAYGDGGNEDIIEANFAGGNFNAATAGVYYIYANLNTRKYKIFKTDWGIIGDATPNGWDADTDLIYNPQTGLWSVTLNFKAGSYKFRANDAWTMVMGDKNGKLTYSDNPVYPYDSTVGAFPIAENGNYTVTLDLNDPGNLKYTITKN